MNKKISSTSVSNAISNLLTATTSQEVFKAIVTEASELFSSKWASLYLEKDDILHRVYSSVPESTLLTNQPSEITRQVFESQELVIADLKQFHGYYQKLMDAGIRTVIYLPLSLYSNPLGVLSISTEGDSDYEDEELNLLKVFGASITLKLHNASLLAEKDKALKTRDMFISMAAHELKTPLTTTSLLIRLIKKGAEKENKLDQKSLTTLESQIDRLVHMVQELLHVDQIEVGRLDYNMEEFPIKDLVDETTYSFISYAPKHKLVISHNVSSLHRITGDKNKLIQVFNNLLRNAAKYSPPDTLITLSTEKKQDHILFHITDQGQGIDEEDLDNIFTLYYQGKNRVGGGMGIGLYLSKKIIEDHGGTITVESKVDEGSTFTVKLPI